MEFWQDEGFHACKDAGKDIGKPGCQVRGVIEVDAALENSKIIFPVSGVYLYNGACACAPCFRQNYTIRYDISGGGGGREKVCTGLRVF